MDVEEAPPISDLVTSTYSEWTLEKYADRHGMLKNSELPAKIHILYNHHYSKWEIQVYMYSGKTGAMIPLGGEYRCVLDPGEVESLKETIEHYQREINESTLRQYQQNNKQSDSKNSKLD